LDPPPLWEALLLPTTYHPVFPTTYHPVLSITKYWSSLAHGRHWKGAPLRALACAFPCPPGSLSPRVPVPVPCPVPRALCMPRAPWTVPRATQPTLAATTRTRPHPHPHPTQYTHAPARPLQPILCPCPATPSISYATAILALAPITSLSTVYYPVSCILHPVSCDIDTVYPA
jgi:hypothetical protein